MPRDLTHASFFSGVGGLDLGMERAGWRTVSFSEIDPYASAVLAERWPGVPNLGNILRLATGPQRVHAEQAPDDAGEHDQDWRSAYLWTGGFPCQDLSVAGKRRGFTGERSVLAFAFLDLVGRHRPPAVLLENVPGLLSSHGGRDLGALLGTLGQLGYGWAYRVLDAQFFDVPQRRRRVFILALDAGRYPDVDGSAAVLAVGSRCDRHPPTSSEAWADAAGRTEAGIGRALSTRQQRVDSSTETFVVGPLDTALGHHGGGWPSQSVDNGHIVTTPGWAAQQRANDPTGREHSGGRIVGGGPESPEVDADRMRAADGLAGRVDDRQELAGTLNSGGNDGGFRRPYEPKGWFGTRDQLLGYLRVVQADRDDAGDFLISGAPITVGIGGVDLVVPAETVYFVGGEQRNLAVGLAGTSYGMAVVVL